MEKRRVSKAKSKKISNDEFLEINDIVKSTPSNNFLDYKIDLKCKTENQKKFLNLIRTKEIIVATGRAGTGKTYLACAEALKLLQSDDKFRKILLVKSVTVLKGEEIGYLRGDMASKIEPFLYSFTGNFNKIIGEEKTKRLMDAKFIEFLPLAYIRGINIDNSIIILDEAQNLSFDLMETILSRIGTNSILILIGDTKQIDLVKKNESALEFIANKFENLHEKIGVCQFTKDDIVRNPLIKIIEDIFDEHKEEIEKNKPKTKR